MTHQIIPLGTFMNMLCVDSEPIRENQRIYYWFRCECGTRKKILSHHVKANKVMSCGCKHKKQYCCSKCNTKNPNRFTGTNKSICQKCVIIRRKKQIQASPDLQKRCTHNVRRSQQKNVSAFLIRKLSYTRGRAKKRMLKFEIDSAFLTKLWQKQNGACAITGIKMTYSYNNLKTISIDRIDNFKGYTEDNVQLVCKAINLGKSQHQNSEMLEFIEEIKKVIR